MTRDESVTFIQQLRQAIRYHRDQKGDDRCWLDDLLLWNLLPDTPPEPRELPPFEEMMRRCSAFYHFRRADVPDPLPELANTNQDTWDDDLAQMDDEQLRQTLTHLQNAIRTHRDIAGRERTLDDDRTLYHILPEKLPADFTLPSEPDFLGEARAPHAGCPSFWRSHQSCACKNHDTHSWGPCRC